MSWSGLASLMATVLLVFCAATVSGLLVAIASSDWAAVEAFGLLTMLYGMIAGLTLIAVGGTHLRLNREQVFSGAIVLWSTLIAAALPAFILIEHQPFLVAFFEAASASVTLGTSLVPADQMSAAMVAYRSVTAWLGGLLTIMLAIYVLGRYAVGGTPNRDLRFVLHGFSRGDPRLSQTFMEVFVPYFALTLMCAAALALARVEPERALMIALNVMATNGLSGQPTGGSVLNNQVAEIIMLIFMIAGATSIILMRAVIGRRVRQMQDGGEALGFVAAVAMVSGLAIIAPLFVEGGHQQLWNGVFNRIFDAVSTMTTTGIIHNPSTGFGLPVELLIGLALVGGGAYSTAGGIKMFRLQAMVRHSTNEVKRLVFPNQLLPNSVDSDDGQFASAKAVWSAFFAALMMVVVFMILFSISGHAFIDSMALSVGAFANVGNLVGAHLYVPEIGGIPSSSLLLVSLAGVAGRVEVLVILAAFGRSRWA